MAPRRTGVAPPPFTPRPFGLFSVATPVEFGDAHERNGVDWRTEPYGPATSYADSCEVPAADRAKEVERGVDYRSTDPFSVYAGDVCSTVGIEPEERDRRSVAALQAGEEYAVEYVLWTGLTGNGEAVSGGFVTPGPGLAPEEIVAGPLDVKRAVAALERFLAEEYGGVGIIHLPVDLASLATDDGVVAPDGSRLRTRLGTWVVAGAGYLGTSPAGDARPAGGGYAVATGPVVVRRGPVDPVGDFRSSVNRATNDAVRIAERTYVVGFAGPVGYLQVVPT